MRDTKAEITANAFVDRLRGEMIVDRQEYQKLVAALERLSGELSEQSVIEKDLALVLYTAPQMVRNLFLDASREGSPVAALANELEEIWIELDALVLECLGSGPG